MWNFRRVSPMPTIFISQPRVHTLEGSLRLCIKTQPGETHHLRDRRINLLAVHCHSAGSNFFRRSHCSPTMALHANDALPKSVTDYTAVSRLSALSVPEFASVTPPLLPWMHWRSNDGRSLIRTDLINLFVSRLTASPPLPDDPLVSVVLSTLASPATTAESADPKHTLLWILAELPKDKIAPYRAALVRLANSPSEAENDLPHLSADLLEFLDTSVARVPRSKGDHLAIRTLALLDTADEMRPHVDGLLEWLQDRNWPPFAGCWEQLARFPALTIEPIREVLRQGNDGEWSAHLLAFMSREMPAELMQQARVELERIVQRPTQDEIDSECPEEAGECLRAIDDWAERAKIFGVRSRSS
ncbi:hypothetical protein DFH06DRAFT_1297919 [Mycena polygramma]|nr:hypothetical protein DFH06DRAFT_1297919 [Mycena polygramma]